jgi:hypothetical protein
MKEQMSNSLTSVSRTVLALFVPFDKSLRARRTSKSFMALAFAILRQSPSGCASLLPF